MTVNEGEAFVAGGDTETAQKLLAAAEKAGLDPSVVRYSADGGFVVPEELAPKPKASDKPAAKTTDKK
ncbi:MAG: hypothetical protein ABWZ30_05475 [Jiangellaceae bacterium]